MNPTQMAEFIYNRVRGNMVDHVWATLDEFILSEKRRDAGDFWQKVKEQLIIKKQQQP